LRLAAASLPVERGLGGPQPRAAILLDDHAAETADSCQFIPLRRRGASFRPALHDRTAHVVELIQQSRARRDATPFCIGSCARTSETPLPPTQIAATKDQEHEDRPSQHRDNANRPLEDLRVSLLLRLRNTLARRPRPT